MGKQTAMNYLSWLWSSGLERVNMGRCGWAWSLKQVAPRNTWLRGYSGLGKQGSRATESGLSRVSLPDVGFRKATLRGAFPLASSIWWILVEVCLAWCCRVASGAGSLRQERWPLVMPTVEAVGSADGSPCRKRKPGEVHWTHAPEPSGGSPWRPSQEQCGDLFWDD